tara:strand:+ start:1236 stop:1589 length:354 start_codon:yes stop_codon:yes gene_type:complete
MNLYRLKASNQFVGTQAEAKASGEDWEPFEFPVNPKADAIAALNALIAEKKVDSQPLVETETDEASTAERITTQNLDGKVNVEGTITFIMKAHVLTLGRIANAVSLRYNELSKRTRK